MKERINQYKVIPRGFGSRPSLTIDKRYEFYLVSIYERID